MILETVIFAIIIAYINGGRFKNIEDLKFKYWYFVILGFMVQQIPTILNNIAGGRYSDLALDIRSSFMIVSYIFIAFPLLFNLKLKGVYFTLIGTVFNGIVIISNSGMMPVTKAAIAATGYDKVVISGQHLDILHFVADDNTVIKTLSDFIPIPRPYPLPQVISFGDILLCIGLFMFVQYILIKKQKDLQVES